MSYVRRYPAAAVFALLGGGLAACAPGFQIKNFAGNPVALYQASMREFQRKQWDNAVAGLDRVTLDLPARDTLLPRAHYYLGQAHEHKGEFLLAAQSFSRLSESFPNDTLADDAMLAAGLAYARLWRKPALDATYGVTAATILRTMLSLYPESNLKDSAESSVHRLDERLATKDYENGMHYFRRGAYDSAIIYFRGVLERFPQTTRARDAGLKLIASFRAPSMHYLEDANEVCGTLRQAYPADPQVQAACGPAPAKATSTTPPPPTPPALATPAIPPSGSPRSR